MAGPPDSQARVSLCIGLTAHRDLLPDQEPQLRQDVRAFLQDLRTRFPDLPLRLISALAEGGDQLVAEEALALGLELVAPLPMPQSEYERDFADDAALLRFRALLARAQVRVLPLAPGLRPGDIAQPGPARDRQYAQLGMFISSHCQVLLALWDGRASQATGGTAQVVEYHLRNTMPSVDPSQVAPNLLADDESDLVYHLPCARASDPRAPTDTQSRWLTLAGSQAVGPGLPGQYGQVFSQMQAFNRDAARYATNTASERLFDAALPGPVPAASAAVEGLFRAADALALHFQRRVRNSLLCTHVLAALMGLSFILYTDVGANRAFVLAFLLLFGLGLLLTLLGRRREWQRKYLDYRGLAEGLRVQLFWRLAGVGPPPDSSLGYDSFLQKQDVELSWIRHAMRGTGLLREEDLPADADWLAWVIRHWIGDAQGLGGQLEYYRRGTLRRERAYRWTTRLGDTALAGGLVGALVLLVGDPERVARMQQPLLLAMGLLPLLAGIREAYSFKKADKELIKQFRFMTRMFESCRERLRLARNDAQARTLLLALGRACLEEHAEWILLHRERPLEHGSLSG